MLVVDRHAVARGRSQHAKQRRGNHGLGIGIDSNCSTPAPAPTFGGGQLVAQPVQQVDLAALVPVVAALAQAVQSLAALAPSTQVAMPGPAPVATWAPTAPTAPIAPSAPIAPAPSGIADGPGVYSRIIPKDRLEQDPKLRGTLDPPTGGKPPKGVKVRTRADGTRMLTINVHGGAPAGRSPSQGRDIRAIRDVARYVNAVDPDVISVQEISDEKGSAIPHLTSVFAHLIGADDMAFTPGDGAKGRRTGTATYTRNGYTIDHTVNLDLPDAGDPARRSAGVSQVIPPNGGEAFTVVSAHLSHMPGVAASRRRRDQLQEIARVVDAVRQGGAFDYKAAGEDGRRHATGFASGRVMLGGDLNTPMQGREAGIDRANELLAAAGLRNVYQLAGENGSRPGIDHVYAYGFQARGNVKFEVQAQELAGGRPTDHPGYVVDLH